MKPLILLALYQNDFEIFYMPTSKPPELPMFTIGVFDKYVSVPFDASNPNIVPITRVIRENRKKFL